MLAVSLKKWSNQVHRPRTNCLLGVAVFSPRKFVAWSSLPKPTGFRCKTTRAPGVLPRRCFYGLHCACQWRHLPRLNQKIHGRIFWQNTISSWWLNQPNWNICASQIRSFSQGSGWKQKICGTTTQISWSFFLRINSCLHLRAPVVAFCSGQSSCRETTSRKRILSFCGVQPILSFFPFHGCVFMFRFNGSFRRNGKNTDRPRCCFSVATHHFSAKKEISSPSTVVGGFFP